MQDVFENSPQIGVLGLPLPVYVALWKSYAINPGLSHVLCIFESPLMPDSIRGVNNIPMTQTGRECSCGGVGGMEEVPTQP